MRQSKELKMEMNTDHVLEIWEMFSEYLPSARRNDVALRFLNYFVDNEMDLDSLEELRGQDEHIDHALDQLTYDQDEEYDEPEEEYEE
jgi:hypothetical protein